MVYVSPSGSVTSTHLEFGELFSANLVLYGEKLWMVIPETALDSFTKGVNSHLISYPGCCFRKKKTIKSLPKEQSIGETEKKSSAEKVSVGFTYEDAKKDCKRGTPCGFCRCRVAAFHESSIFSTQAFLDKHEIPRAFISQRAGDLVLINKSCAHLVYNRTDTAAGKFVKFNFV